MSNLRTLIESIVTDVINARYDADVQTANLAERYRDNEILRSFNIPSLNISNVSVDLRMAFDDQAIEEADGPSEEQISAIATGATAITKYVMSLDAVKRKLADARIRNGFSRSLNSEIKKALTGSIDGGAKLRRERIQAAIKAAFGRSRITLKLPEYVKLADEIQKTEAVVASAPRALPKNIPGIKVGLGALTGVDPAAISSIKFEINLNDARWNDIETPDGAIKSVLSED